MVVPGPTPPGCGRFAPTPTGRLHLGNLRTAWLAELASHSFGHRFVLRIDDLDPKATIPGMIEAQIDDLAWFGIKFDEGYKVGGESGPYLQSQRYYHYRRALHALNEMGLLYPCWCSRKEVLAAAQAPHESNQSPLYPGTCRPDRPTPIDNLDKLPERRGRRPALRLNIREAFMQLGLETLSFDDLVAGKQPDYTASTLDDFVVRRVDGIASYQIACAVDDALMNCELVVRGADLLISTIRQIMVLKLLKHSIPKYAHIGLVVGHDGKRLAKRDQSVAIADLRQRKVDPMLIRHFFEAGVFDNNSPSTETRLHHLKLDDRLMDPVRLPKQSPWSPSET